MSRAGSEVGTSEVGNPGSPPASAGRRAVTVRPVDGSSELGRFIRFPWSVQSRDPNWVPPLISDVRAALNPAKHPFHAHADVQCSLAWRGDTLVGRIAAIHNRTHVEFQDERAGFFGLFECLDDADVAGALLDAAEGWVRARGLERIRGPMNLSTNEELSSPGILVDGFDTPPSILMSHNPPYYARLVESNGYVKSKDLLAYWLEGREAPERVLRGVEKIRKRENVQVRPLELRRFKEEVRTVQDIYNSAWERNWGFVPMSAAEIEHMAKQLRPIVDPALCLFAEIDGETVAFGLGLPDYNRALRHVDGRLFPFGLIKLLWYRRKIDAARVITLGVKPGFRHKGLDALIITELFRAGARGGMSQGECSWILEDNWDMRRGLERIGAEVYKTYRVYEKDLIV
jgi:GNAT superfamily N-acetyltransferase